MKVTELIKELEEYDPEMQVFLSDGYYLGEYVKCKALTLRYDPDSNNIDAVLIYNDVLGTFADFYKKVQSTSGFTVPCPLLRKVQINAETKD